MPEPEGPFEPIAEFALWEVLDELERLYPDADCELRHENALQLLIATILSAQSTDVRVNLVTASLFKRYRSALDFAAADPAVFEQEIRSTGFFRNKTKSVLGAARKITDDFAGEVPDTMEDLVTLPGVARKTANVVLGTWFKKPVGVVVDTHIGRLARRLGISRQTDPVRVERDLMNRLPQDRWIFAGHAIIWHGRRVCSARRPDCANCTLAAWCPRNGLLVCRDLR